MKKFALALSVILALAAFTACSPKPSSSVSTGSSTSTPAAALKVEGTLQEILDKLYVGIGEDKLPGTMTSEITEEMSVNFTGVEIGEYKEALASDALINATAHSVVLVRAENEDAAKELAVKIEEKANPRKWICVEAETKTVTQIGDLVLLVMTYEDVEPLITANFKALAK